MDKTRYYVEPPDKGLTREELKAIEDKDFAERQARGKKAGEVWAKREQKLLAEREEKLDRIAKILKVDRKNMDELLLLLRTI